MRYIPVIILVTYACLLIYGEYLKHTELYRRLTRKDV